MFIFETFLYSGTSINKGEEVPCEIHKQSIVNTIINGIDEDIFENENNETTSHEIDEQNNTETDYLEQLSSPFTSWLSEIVKSADVAMANSDDGDRDNLMYNRQ